MAIISVYDLRSHLNIPDEVDDTPISIAADAACAWVIQHCGRSFEVTASGSESARVFRPKSPTLTITDDFSSTTNLTVKTDDGDDGTYENTLTLNSDFIVEPLNGIEDGLTVPYRRIVATSWLFTTLSTVAPVQVTARWGWAAVPGAVKQAALIEGARLFKRRTSPEGVLGGFQDYGAVRVSGRDDPDAVALLRPYVRPETALYR